MNLAGPRRSNGGVASRPRWAFAPCAVPHRRCLIDRGLFVAFVQFVTSLCWRRPSLPRWSPTGAQESSWSRWSGSGLPPAHTATARSVSWVYGPLHIREPLCETRPRAPRRGFPSGRGAICSEPSWRRATWCAASLMNCLLSKLRLSTKQSQVWTWLTLVGGWWVVTQPRQARAQRLAPDRVALDWAAGSPACVAYDVLLHPRGPSGADRRAVRKRGQPRRQH